MRRIHDCFQDHHHLRSVTHTPSSFPSCGTANVQHTANPRHRHRGAHTRAPYSYTDHTPQPRTSPPPAHLSVVHHRLVVHGHQVGDDWGRHPSLPRRTPKAHVGGCRGKACGGGKDRASSLSPQHTLVSKASARARSARGTLYGQGGDARAARAAAGTRGQHAQQQVREGSRRSSGHAHPPA
jgi:hypothetical protein